MIDHLSTYATDYDRTRDFYQVVLAPLGVERHVEMRVDEPADPAQPDGPRLRICAFGEPGTTMFWIVETHEPATPRHVAFQAGDRKTVRAFHAAGLRAGASDHGAPGLRCEYHEHYYAAFLLDPDGNNIEAVCHQPDAENL